jgi:Ca2+-binding RTX toxin-like protein
MKRITTVLLALIAFTVALTGVAWAATVHCPSKGDCEGTKASDRLIGTPDRDQMHGYAKADTLIAHSGNDDASGGYGRDEIRLGQGNDRAFAGRGDDVVFAVDGERDKLVCGKGERDVVKADEVDAIGNTCEVKRVSK